MLSHYEHLIMPEGFAAAIRATLDEVLADPQRSAKLMSSQIQAQLKTLGAQEENLLDLAADAALPRQKVRARLVSIAEQRERLRGESVQVDERLVAGVAVIHDALELIERVGSAYAQAPMALRRQYNKIFFKKLYIDRATACGRRFCLSRSTSCSTSAAGRTLPCQQAHRDGRRAPGPVNAEAAPQRTLLHARTRPACSSELVLAGVAIRTLWWS